MAKNNKSKFKLTPLKLAFLLFAILFLPVALYAVNVQTNTKSNAWLLVPNAPTITKLTDSCVNGNRVKIDVAWNLGAGAQKYVGTLYRKDDGVFNKIASFNYDIRYNPNYFTFYAAAPNPPPYYKFKIYAISKEGKAGSATTKAYSSVACPGWETM